ncbi:signal peptidase II [Candidatus Peregrinibacteria bacterium]|nr:signal peptidase II [Candidatus Peregrinibacteria bacterium]
MKKSLLFTLSLAIDIVIADQITKWLASEYLEKPFQLFSGVSFEYAENTGVAFSLPIPYIVLIPFSVLMVGAILFYASKYLKMEHPASIIAVAFITGGAVGNIIDRILRGFVIDFIKVGWWPTFNLADSFLVIGIFLLIAFYGKISRSNHI